MSILKYFFTRFFLINLAIYAVLLVVVLWLIFSSISSYTLHGETITVPDMKGFNKHELANFLSDKNLQYVIMDSVFDETASLGAVIAQNPLPGVQVKKGRKIYLTINAMQPQKVHFPNLRDVTLRQAYAILETYGIEVADLKYKPDQCVNCVLGAMIDSTEINPGTLMQKGTAITLVLGSGLSNEAITVPVLINLSLAQIAEKLKPLGLNLGSINYEDCTTTEDSLSAKVFRQIPDYGVDSRIFLGQSIDVFLTCDSTKIPTIPVDSAFSIQTNHAPN